MVGPSGYTLPASQHDIVIWLSGSGYDVVFDLSRSVATELADRVRLANEIVGWPYHHDLDLTGFIDGTENPTLVEATAVALVPPGSPFEGGSILLLQQWEHDAIAWEGLPVEAQEDVIGRRRATARSSIRDHRPRMSRGRTRNVRQDLPAEYRLRLAGEPRDDLRRLQRGPADPARDARQHGRPRWTARLLTRFTRPLTGAYYVIPSSDALAALGGSDGDPGSGSPRP